VPVLCGLLVMLLKRFFGVAVVAVAMVVPMYAQSIASFEILTHRMDVDVDGAPRAYGPPGKQTLDYLSNAHLRGNPDAEVVGYLTDDDHPNVPVKQGPGDPAPGYYISQTAYTDKARTDERDVRRYVDATKINYVVLGSAAKRRGARLGDFVAVYSKRTGKAVFGIVGDDGNPSGDEGSLHLLQELGYPWSNPERLFFRTQAGLDEAAESAGVSKDFGGSPGKGREHPTAQ